MLLYVSILLNPTTWESQQSKETFQQKPSQIIVALPVGPPTVIAKINNMSSVKNTICLLTPSNFQAVGQFYKEFYQVDDSEVIRLLKEANQTTIKD